MDRRLCVCVFVSQPQLRSKQLLLFVKYNVQLCQSFIVDYNCVELDSLFLTLELNVHFLTCSGAFNCFT